MSIRIALNHFTHYRYDRMVALSPHVVRLRPAPHCRTPILAYSLNIKPDTHFINWQQDPFGNYQARLVFPEKTRELSVEVDLVADLTVINPFDFFVEDYAEHYPFQYAPELAEELAPYLKIREHGPLLQQWLSEVDHSPCIIVDFLVALNQRLQQDIFYNVRMEPGVQSCEVTLQKANGSCRDSAWLLVQILRHLGLAARFVSGYLVQLVADVKALDGPSGPEADFTDLHAWTEVFLPGAGWVGLDPTSGLFAAEGHIPLACTPDPGSAAPVTGAADKSEVDFYFHNQVSRLFESPRVTKPYSETEWRIIDALGHKVDLELNKNDVRLTMGGEPTFVSIDDMDGAEWNTAALGEDKRRLAGQLLWRLRECFAPGGLLHFGQGKWYPGEPLPRWALNCFWRKDGIPVWRDDSLIAKDDKDYAHDDEHAQNFAKQLARQLALDPAYIIPAYEDPLYHLWQETQTPINLDPTKLKEPVERRRLAEVLSAGLGKAAGYALPLRKDNKHWCSCVWQFRREQMFLLPGDSPIGLRLPLDALPWVEPARRDADFPRDPFDQYSPLADYHKNEQQHILREQRTETDANGEIIHTALCIEVRNSCVHVFLPPLNRLEDYLELIAALEKSAAELNLPLRIEGYPAPVDPRIQRFSVTPDPGVIEVNVHPAHNWRELVDNTETLYEQARLSRLGTEKFMLDGRHTGTGGGNHITLGGASPADSPLLRRPDLLRSLVTFWQHHPGLSYLFSGLFIGPTSQAPRVDEARSEALYELDIAFRLMPEGEVPQPWLVDRLLRHLLVDLTGNTHRAEFCIDKLYSPDSATGRLGLLEMRAFEMPPHARMSLVQMLLVRTLIAYFWQHPYRKPLVHWGTQLHDRFMLPHYVWADMRDIIGQLQQAGYAFQLDWLAPFYEFRFPRYGSIQVDDIELELRLAIEPWHVLGEEASGSGTARFVDSSLERLQVKLAGATDSRHILVCNGRRLPLHNTGTQGEYVAGIRYRAWQPPSALHPTIPVHVPLVFDVIDSWNGRAIGGCTYHVSHPGGRSHEDFPVNANVAETRRMARFFDFGHTPGPIEPPPDIRSLGKFTPEGSISGPYQPPETDVINPEYPYTLDLRR